MSKGKKDQGNGMAGRKPWFACRCDGGPGLVRMAERQVCAWLRIITSGSGQLEGNSMWGAVPLTNISMQQPTVYKRLERLGVKVGVGGSPTTMSFCLFFFARLRATLAMG